MYGTYWHDLCHISERTQMDVQVAKRIARGIEDKFGVEVEPEWIVETIEELKDEGGDRIWEGDKELTFVLSTEDVLLVAEEVKTFNL